MKKIKLDNKLREYIDYVLGFYKIDSLLLETLNLSENSELTADLFIPDEDYHDDYRGLLPHSFTDEDFTRTLDSYKKMNLTFLVPSYTETVESIAIRKYDVVEFEKYFYLGNSVFFFFHKPEEDYTYVEMFREFKSDPGFCLITSYPLNMLHKKEVTLEVLSDIIKGTVAIILDVYDGDSYMLIDLTNRK